MSNFSKKTMDKNASKSGEQFSHIDNQGQAQMVDVGAKEDSQREARATANISMSATCFNLLASNQMEKGDVLSVARIAGIQAAKQTHQLIPLCHPLMLTKISVDFELSEETHSLKVFSRCALKGKTGVEMEALTAASIAALTVYDMCKAVDKGIVISDLFLLEKSGGKSGNWQRS
jgi:cyclic pyranopterin phosphate synthase